MKKKKDICVVTATRAEYFLLYPLLKLILNDEKLELKLVVTGAHLSQKYGMTVSDIEKDKFQINEKIEILNNTDSIYDIDIAMGRAIVKFGEYFESSNIDLLIILGDRYEMLSIAIAAMNSKIPIAHIHGGETTEGAMDEAIRHAITKISYLHFTSCESYRKRVIQLGESPDRVFNVGALGVENIKNAHLVKKEDLEKQLDFKLKKPLVLFTFHPTTLESNVIEKEMKHILKALEEFQDLTIIFTKANADSGGLIINHMLDDYVRRHKERSMVVYSLGQVRYLSVMNIADIVIGNSSSGVLETPTFGVPTINIGCRQKGRIQAKNIINCNVNKEEIKTAIEKALSEEFRKKAKEANNPYDNGMTSEKILNKIKEILFYDKINLKKSFYDLKNIE